jgi:hypothetical protein
LLFVFIFAHTTISPPTTTAAFLIPHGTHDNVVQFQENWIDGIATPSCECNGLSGGQSSCFYDGNWISMVGPTLASGIAKLRGYDGDAFGADIEALPASHLNLVDMDPAKCQDNINKCISPFAYPNPWNDNYPCSDLQEDETDVYVLPTSDERSGPVVLWKINNHNHDYPNRRRSDYGPTEFFFQLKKFFYANRGRNSKPIRSTGQIIKDQVCAGDFDGFVPPGSFFRYDYWSNEHPNVTPEECQKLCQDDFRCTDAFYGEYSADLKFCKFYYDAMPCESTVPRTWGNMVHYKMGDLLYSPTSSPSAAPIPSPTLAPTTSSPVATTPPAPAPTDPTPNGICSVNELNAGATAGYSCLGGLGGDSNFGTTEEQCLGGGGLWQYYDCGTAEAYWNILPEEDDLRDILKSVWEPKCCGASPVSVPTPAPYNDPTPAPPPPTDPTPNGICSINTFNADAPAGYSCSGGSNDGGDSNFDTTEAQCLGGGGEWLYYDCGTADSYWISYPEGEIKDALKSVWEPQCCGEIIDNALCLAGAVLNNDALAGYACLVNDASIGDSNFGYTEEMCDAEAGAWTTYDCATAGSHFEGVTEYEDDFRAAWAPKCCSDPVPIEDVLCLADTVLNNDALAGYACLVNDASIGDSNFGYTEEMCDAEAGAWTTYDCATAGAYFEGVTEYEDDFRAAWAPKCCSDEGIPPARALKNLRGS